MSDQTTTEQTTTVTVTADNTVAALVTFSESATGTEYAAGEVVRAIVLDREAGCTVRDIAAVLDTDPRILSVLGAKSSGNVVASALVSESLMRVGMLPSEAIGSACSAIKSGIGYPAAVKALANVTTARGAANVIARSAKVAADKRAAKATAKADESPEFESGTDRLRAILAEITSAKSDLGTLTDDTDRAILAEIAEILGSWGRANVTTAKGAAMGVLAHV